MQLALAGAFESRLDGRTEEAIARLDTAARFDLGLPHYYRGTWLARLPGCAGRAKTSPADQRACGWALKFCYERLERTRSRD